MTREKYIIISRDRFRRFLVGFLDAAAVDEVLQKIELDNEVVELGPGDRLARFSDVEYALKKVGGAR